MHDSKHLGDFYEITKNDGNDRVVTIGKAIYSVHKLFEAWNFASETYITHDTNIKKTNIYDCHEYNIVDNYMYIQ